MTDQFRWQGALAAAERAIRAEQFEEAADSLRIALTHIGTFERNDPARILILELFLRCCERAITLSAEQSSLALKHRAAQAQRIIALADGHSSLTLRQAAAQLPDDLAERRRCGKISHRLHNRQIAAQSMLLNSQVPQLGEDDDAVVTTLLTLARLEWNRNEFKSFPYLHHALTIRERTLGSDHPDTLAIVWKLAASYDMLTNYKEAIPLWQRLLNYVELTGPQTLGTLRYEVPDLLFKLGNAYNGVRLYSEAKQIWLRYLAITQHEPEQTIGGLTRVGTIRINAYYGVGQASLAQGNWGEAADYLALAVERHQTIPAYIVDDGNGVSQVDLASGIAAYAEAVSQVGDHDRAIQLCEEAIVLYRRRDRRYIRLLGTYATALRALGDGQKAVTIEHEASTLKENFEAKMRRQHFHKSAHPDLAQS
jgi:tetratricopeptide (TPR) repeat protein